MIVRILIAYPNIRLSPVSDPQPNHFLAAYRRVCRRHRSTQAKPAEGEELKRQNTGLERQKMTLTLAIGHPGLRVMLK